MSLSITEKSRKTGKRSELTLGSMRVAVKDRKRKQIKKQNAPELTKEQIVGKIEREVKRKHREKKRSCWKRKVVYYRIN